ncbi:MAG: DHH family phosphoesterase [Synergistales bacterium]|nr:DHH family phosphoesterase [Synergistales bacterium]MDY6402030.1 DHH family phosphoesterase [Synergistales bacterium]MDY6404195.1 DHH family phosphoesterase [Synergistales bacterium]MDY6411159.1 DHH family phosphoesterase [Synergistales bacterium]MDY6413962.1 DHH family phosphoesterase [Synergistales bacterium]
MTTMIAKKFNPDDLLIASKTLKAYGTWKIFTHAKADGDAWGSSTALYTAGKNLGKNVCWLNPDEKLSDRYKYLSGFNAHITCEKFDFVNENDVLYIFLDCSNEERGTLGFDSSKNINALNIDHHEDNNLFGRVNCVDGEASSTCEMLYRIFEADSWEITQAIAESLYTGIFTDTGGFSFSNTSPLTHNIAAELIKLGAEPAHMSDLISQNKTPADFLLWSRAMSRVKMFGPENIFAISILYASDFQEVGADMTGTEGLSSMFMTIRGVKLISTITEYPTGEIRLSIRSREGSPFGAGEFARTLGGGGHERAAGAELKVPINDAVNELEKLIMQKYHECLNSH